MNVNVRGRGDGKGEWGKGCRDMDGGIALGKRGVLSGAGGWD